MSDDAKALMYWIGNANASVAENESDAATAITAYAVWRHISLVAAAEPDGLHSPAGDILP